MENTVSQEEEAGPPIRGVKFGDRFMSVLQLNMGKFWT
jgi:hypothetical protein